MEQLTEKITAVRDELAKVQAKIPAKDSNSAVSKDKETFKQLFDSLLNQKKGAFWLYIWAFGMERLLVAATWSDHSFSHNISYPHL